MPPRVVVSSSLHRGAQCTLASDVVGLRPVMQWALANDIRDLHQATQGTFASDTVDLRQVTQWALANGIRDLHQATQGGSRK